MCVLLSGLFVLQIRDARPSRGSVSNRGASLLCNCDSRHHICREKLKGKTLSTEALEKFSLFLLKRNVIILGKIMFSKSFGAEMNVLHKYQYHQVNPLPCSLTVIPLYLYPGVSSIRCDEDTDISTGQLRSNHTWKKLYSSRHDEMFVLLFHWRYIEHRYVDGFQFIYKVNAGRAEGSDREAAVRQQQHGCANQIIFSPDAIIIPGAESLLTMFPEV